MQKQATTWRALAALAVLASCGLSVFAGAGGDKKDAPKPLPPEIVKAWTDADFVVGWMKRGSNFVQFLSEEKGEAGTIPAFRFRNTKTGVLVKLHDPGAAFGLYLDYSAVKLAIAVRWVHTGDARRCCRAAKGFASMQNRALTDAANPGHQASTFHDALAATLLGAPKVRKC